MNSGQYHRALAAAALLASMCIDAVAMPTTSQFASGSDGWTGGGGSAAWAWKSSGGVDDSGYFQTTDVAGGQMTAISPAYGNQVAVLGGTLSFAYDVFALGVGNHYVPNSEFGIVTIYSGTSYVTADLIADVPFANNLVGTGWHQASRALVDGLWVGNASLAAILANVTKVSIVTEYDGTQRWPDEVVGIDNFAFAPRAVAAAQVPEPPSSAMFLLGASFLVYRVRRRRRR